jgi:hypothetical protein
MVDFSALGKREAGLAKKPPNLPVADYPGIIKSYEIGDANANKTPYLRLAIGITGLPDSLDEDARATLEGVDLSKRSLRKDFYLSEDALWRLDEFLRDMELIRPGVEYQEIWPELVGRHVLVSVGHYVNQKTMEVGNQINGLAPL